jgi:hypothetical protein
MRIAESWTLPQYRIVVYTLDTSWYVEFEAGPMKQGYKLSKEKYASLAAVKEALDTPFLDAVYEHFNKMFSTLKELNEKG